jgi:hypothetical protein
MERPKMAEGQLRKSVERALDVSGGKKPVNELLKLVLPV